MAITTEGVRLRNEDIIQAISQDASLEYQRRIPDPTQVGLQATMQALNDNPIYWNEFIHAIVNRIGRVIVRRKIWTNPLREFKTDALMNGSSIEEMGIGLLQAKSYSADRDYMEKDLFGQELPEVKAYFHRINREDMYKVTINEMALKRAFLAGENALQSFIDGMMNAPMNSDQWDEFLIMCRLFREYEENVGFKKIHIPAIDNLTANGDDARLALRTMRAVMGEMSYLNTAYNGANMPTFTNSDEIVVFGTPKFRASLDVEALAGAFNINKMEVEGRFVMLPENQLGFAGAQAIIADKDFFVVADTLLENRVMPNPAGLYTNFFLHHHGIYSASKFANAVMLTSDTVEEITVSEPNVTSVVVDEVLNSDSEVVTALTAGQNYLVKAHGVTTPASDVGTAVKFSIGSDELLPHTRIDRNGILHIDENQDTDVVITVTSVIKEDVNVEKTYVVGTVDPAE